MALVLAEQTLLIAFDDEKGRDTTDWGSDAGLAAALLLDVARLELLEVDADGKLVALDGVSPGHDLVRDAYATIRSSAKRRNAKGWVHRLPRSSSRCGSAWRVGSCEWASSPRSTPRDSASCRRLASPRST